MKTKYISRETETDCCVAGLVERFCFNYYFPKGFVTETDLQGEISKHSRGRAKLSGSLDNQDGLNQFCWWRGLHLASASRKPQFSLFDICGDAKNSFYGEFGTCFERLNHKIVHHKANISTC